MSTRLKTGDVHTHTATRADSSHQEALRAEAAPAAEPNSADKPGHHASHTLPNGFTLSEYSYSRLSTATFDDREGPEVFATLARRIADLAQHAAEPANTRGPQTL